MAKINEHTEDEFDEVGKVIGNAEAFVEKNKNYVLYAIIFIALVIGGVYFYNSYKHNQEIEAENQLFVSEQLFAADSFKLALGDTTLSGFIYVATTYSGTSTGNLAKGYAGLCYLKLGEYKEALSYLKDFDGNDILVSPSILGAIGDAYSDLKDYSNAQSYYNKASSSKLDIVTPLYMRKEGIVKEAQSKYADALVLYNKIKDQYPESVEAAQINNDIARVKVKLQLQ